MTPEIKKQLEEECDRSGLKVGTEHRRIFLLASQVAWDLAVKYQNERVKQLLARAQKQVDEEGENYCRLRKDCENPDLQYEWDSMKQSEARMETLRYTLNILQALLTPPLSDVPSRSVADEGVSDG